MRDGSVRYGRCKRRVTRENKSWFFVVLIIDFLPRNSRSQNGNSNSYDFGFRCALRPAIATHAKECGIARQPKTRIEEKRSEMWSTSLWRRKQRTRLEMDWIGVRDFAGVFVYLREPQRLGRPGGMPEVHAPQSRPLTMAVLRHDQLVEQKYSYSANCFVQHSRPTEEFY